MVRLVVATALSLAVVGVGLRRLESWVENRRSPVPEIAMEWADLPKWLQLPDNRHVLDDLERCAGVANEHDWNDADLTRRVAARLSDPEVGWIRRVIRVVKQAPNRLVVHGEYREPVAWIPRGNHAFLVDDAGVRLPGRYARAAISDTTLIDVIGVRRDPPPVGSTWQGDDVSGAMRLVRLVETQPFRNQVSGISVENFESRRTGRSKLELLTDRPGARIWWGSVPGFEDAVENTAAEKLLLLRNLYHRTGRIDLNRDYVDIMTWRDRVAVSATADGVAVAIGGDEG